MKKRETMMPRPQKQDAQNLQAGSANPACEQARTQLLAQLRRKIHRLESTTRADDGSIIRTGTPAMDQTLPDGGYHRGTIIEWIVSHPEHSRPNNLALSSASGADFLSLSIAIRAAADGGAIVIADPLHQFYPPAAAAMGLNLGNVIILRPEVGGRIPGARQSLNAGRRSHHKIAASDSLLWAIDQSLRCPAVAAVWAPLETIGERWFRRFQLSAESSGVVGLFVRPASAMNRPSWAEVQWGITSQTSAPETNDIRDYSTQARRVAVKLLRCRGGRTGQQINLEIDTITGRVRGQLARRDHHDSTQSATRRSQATLKPQPALKKKYAS